MRCGFRIDRVRVQLEVLYCRCDRIVDELQGCRLNAGEFCQIMSFLLVLTKLKEHVTCQDRMKDALRTGGFRVINTDYTTVL